MTSSAISGALGRRAMDASRVVWWLVPATIAVGLTLDTRMPGWGQWLANGLSWLALAVLLLGSRRAERRRLVLCVIIATLGECFLSLVWGLYEYRVAGGIPLFVPPGHALLFAWGVHASRFAPRWLPWTTLASFAGIVTLGVLLRTDTEGVLWFSVLAACVVLGRRRRLYATMFLLATTLELVGTSMGAWYWHPEVPWLGLTSWNPPPCAGVLYCLLDLLVLKADRALVGFRGLPKRVTG